MEKIKLLNILKSQMEGLHLIKQIITTENIYCNYKEEITILCFIEEKNVEVLNNQYNLLKKDNDCKSYGFK